MATSANILRCPFCDRPIEEPDEIRNRFSSFTGGKCGCGAVYAFDRSGHRLGDAYVDALVYACDDYWDRAWSLIPDEDYEVRELRYDSRRNKFSRSQRRTQPTYLFVMVKKERKIAN
jgi:hypothetical protein